MPDMVYPPDNVWVNYPLPCVEGRCIPEKRMSLKDGEWIFEYRYPKPSEETDDEDDEPEIDIIPVVRCKHCKHFDGINCKVNDITNIMDTNWFCADGERK